MSRPLNPKQLRFVEEYLVDLNATQAAIRAGYSAKTAGSQGFDLLKKPEIQAALAAGRREQARRTEVSVDFVIQGLREVAMRCMQRVPVMVGQGKDRRQATTADGQGVWEFDSAGANRSLELLGKHVGAFDAAEDDVPPTPVAVTVNVVDGRKG